MEILQFIFQDLEHFLGAIIILETLTLPLRLILRNRNKEKNG